MDDVKWIGGALSAVLLGSLLLIAVCQQSCAAYNERMIAACAEACGVRGMLMAPMAGAHTGRECRP